MITDASGTSWFSSGFIDPHVHVYLPFMGTYAKDTWETASKAALIGGTTTLIEMICPNKIDQPMAAFETWLGKASGAASCDFTFHMGVTHFDDSPAPKSHFRDIVKRAASRASGEDLPPGVQGAPWEPMTPRALPDATPGEGTGRGGHRPLRE